MKKLLVLALSILTLNVFAQTVQDSDSASATATLEVLGYVVLGNIPALDFELTGGTAGAQGAMYADTQSFDVTANTDYTLSMEAGDLAFDADPSSPKIPVSYSLSDKAGTMIADGAAQDLDGDANEISLSNAITAASGVETNTHSYSGDITLGQNYRKGDYSKQVDFTVQAN